MLRIELTDLFCKNCKNIYFQDFLDLFLLPQQFEILTDFLPIQIWRHIFLFRRWEIFTNIKDTSSNLFCLFFLIDYLFFQISFTDSTIINSEMSWIGRQDRTFWTTPSSHLYGDWHGMRHPLSAGLADMNDCPRCGSGLEETVEHAFYYCERVRPFWDHVGDGSHQTQAAHTARRWLRRRQSSSSVSG